MNLRKDIQNEFPLLNNIFCSPIIRTCKKGKFRSTEEVSVDDESEFSVRELSNVRDSV